ncbi:Phage protein [Acetobacter malorum]|nr:Phage protein [Acetobacter malorum]
MAETLRVQSLPAQADVFRPYQPPKGVRGDGRTHLAMDSAASANPGLLGWLRQAVAEGTAFPGYPRLAELSQRAEYRHMVEVIAAEATREWIIFRARGTADKKQRLADIEREFIRLNVRDVLRRMAEYDGYYGMGLLYVDTGQPRTGGGLETPLLLRPETFRKGSLRALVPIEPVWTTPDQYDTANPLSTEFYQPSRWWVQGGLLHSTRLLQFVSRPVPDLLKPAYNFGGLSLSQMARPAVENWLRTRQSVSDLLNAFSIVALSTDMSAYAQDPEGLLSRIEAFNRFRSNRGTFVLDKDREKLELLAAPLAGLDRLQAQAQEQMCAVAQEPLVKFTGITPSGLNASADGEIRVFYDRVHAFQETLYRKNLTTILHMVMLNLWGEIDPDIDFTFVFLWQMDELARATLQKTRADIDAQNIRSGIITPAEARSRTASPLSMPGQPARSPSSTVSGNMKSNGRSTCIFRPASPSHSRNQWPLPPGLLWQMSPAHRVLLPHDAPHQFPRYRHTGRSLSGWHGQPAEWHGLFHKYVACIGCFHIHLGGGCRCNLRCHIRGSQHRQHLFLGLYQRAGHAGKALYFPAPRHPDHRRLRHLSLHRSRSGNRLGTLPVRAGTRPRRQNPDRHMALRPPQPLLGRGAG